MQKISVKIIFVFSLWFLVTAALTGEYFWRWINTAHNVSDENALYVIPAGASLYRVADDLHQKNLLRWPRVWVWYARLMNLTDIKAGEYRLAEKESPISLLTRFQAGKIVQYQITLVEGLTLTDFLHTLHNHKQVKSIISIPENISDLHIDGVDKAFLEGWFFPDTYQFSRGDTDQSILLRAHKKMLHILEYEWEHRAENLPYSSPYEALIMASIVKKETGVAYERRAIAGVFVRRLQKNMRLQTDPTVIYGLGSVYDGNITRKDLKTPTPYNTYVIKGLPPSPIAMPGKEAIHAALHPDSSDNLYFVARGDGTHYFSETLDEHNRAVVKFQKSRVINYRSSPDLQSELMPAEESVLTPVATPVAKPLASPIAKPIGVLETTEGDK